MPLSSQERAESPHGLPAPVPLPRELSRPDFAGFDPGAGRGRDSLPPGLSANPNALALLRALRARWLFAASLALFATLVTAVAVWYFVPVPYTARATINMRSQI